MKKIFKLLEKTGLPVFFQERVGELELPCIVYEFYSPESKFLKFDDKQEEIINIIVRLYQSKRIFSNEKKLEDIFAKNEIAYEKYYATIDKGLCETSYHFEKLKEEIIFYEQTK